MGRGPAVAERSVDNALPESLDSSPSSCETTQEDYVMGHVVAFSFLVTTGFLLLPLGADAQAIRIHGKAPSARKCLESAREAVALGSTTPQARKACDTALEVGGLRAKDRAATHSNRGILSMALEEYASALRDFDVASRLYPDHGAIYVNRGNVLFISGSYDSAIEEYTRALSAEMSEFQVAYLNRGMAHEILGHRAAAADDYRQALAIAPEWGVAISKLARVTSNER
jgi:tetratricopeptide (TPR) repeat protein